MEEIPMPEGGTIARSHVSTECPCGAEIVGGDFVVQLFGVPILYCVPCGTERILGTDDQDGTTDSFDLVGTLAGDYQLRRQLGWPTPPAVLLVDDEVGPTWRVGATEDEVANPAGRGCVVGDRLELTLFHTLEGLEAR